MTARTIIIAVLSVAIVAALLAAPHVLKSYGIYILSLWAVTTIGAMGLNLTLGYAGQISLAQAAFVGIGAYCSAILTKAGYPLPVAYLLAFVSCFSIGWILGYPALRVEHHYLAFVTLAFTTLVYLVFRNEEWLTGGVSGIGGIPRPVIFGYSLRSADGFLLFLPRQSGGDLARLLVDDPLAMGPGLCRGAGKPGAGALARRRYPALYADGLCARRGPRRHFRRRFCRRSCNSSIRRRSRSPPRSICC